MSADREAAAQLDVAIDALLDHPGGLVAIDDHELLATARLLRSVLPGFHPRSGFEERLARRLAAAGRSAAGSGGEPVPLHPGPLTDGGLLAAIRLRRGLLAGGAIASGVSLAIPIAGAALLAWRRARTSGGTL